MTLLNTTFHVHSSIDQLFIEWIKQIYIPAAQNAGLSNALFTRILADTDPEGKSYAIQLHAPTMEHATTWHDNEAAKLKDELALRWGERVLHFTTYMEILN